MKDITKIVCSTCNQTMKIMNYRTWKCDSCGFTTTNKGDEFQ